MRAFALSACFLAALVSVNGHGRLLDPPSRATLWRFSEFQKYNPVPNYDDNQLFCGGVQVQYEVNGGKCGLCGDPYNVPAPRPHEGGGLYGRGLIVRNYTAGQTIPISVDLTASHLGYFEIRLCPHNNPLVPATQECLDQHVLPLLDGSTKFPINNFDKTVYSYNVRLPEGVTCEQCVLQWHYNTGNSHGFCEDGSFELGCGNQENFRACADIRITA